MASTAEIASSDMNEMATIDHAELSMVGKIHNSKPAWPTYFRNVSPEAMEMNTAGIWMPTELPATAIFY